VRNPDKAARVTLQSFKRNFVLTKVEGLRSHCPHLIRSRTFEAEIKQEIFAMLAS
jgi:hypothetical protein